MAKRETATDNRLPPEVRGFVALLALDAGIGLWLALHAPGSLPIYLTTHLPAIGIGGIVWSLLPDKPKDAVGDWLVRVLAHPAFLRSIIAVTSIGLLASGLFSTLTVRSADPKTGTELHAVYGSIDQPGMAARSEAKPQRLSRLEPQARWFLITGPTGIRMWLYTDSLVSVDRTARPWFPISVEYPEDFVQMVTLAILPNDEALARLSRDAATFRLFDKSGGLSKQIGQGVLGEHGTFVTFKAPSDHGSVEVERWEKLLMQRERADTSVVQLILKKWLADDLPDRGWIPTLRPLVIGQTVAWEVRSGSTKTLLASGQATFKDRVTDLPLSLAKDSQ